MPFFTFLSMKGPSRASAGCVYSLDILLTATCSPWGKIQCGVLVTCMSNTFLFCFATCSGEFHFLPALSQATGTDWLYTG